MKLDEIVLPENKTYLRVFFIVIILITFILGIGILNLETDNDVTVLLPDNEDIQQEREKIERLSREFPASDNLLFIAIRDNPFSLPKIKKLWQFCNEINALDSVQSTVNPFNAFYFRKIGRTFIPDQFDMKKYPETQAEIDDYLDKIRLNRYIYGTIMSYDQKAAGMLVRMNSNAIMGKPVKNKNFLIKAVEFISGKQFGPKKIDRTYFCHQVEKVIKKYDKDFMIYFAGLPAYEAKSKDYMARDIVILLIPIIFMMIITLYLNFRSLRGTFLPIITMFTSMIWTIGIIGWIRYRINVIGILIPPIVMTIGSSYTLHYLNAYYLKASASLNSRQLVLESTHFIFPTITMASFTTMIGFGSFLIARINPIKKFGIFIILSIAFTLFLTFFLLSKILFHLKVPAKNKIDFVKKDIFSNFLKIINQLVFPLRYFWLGIFLVVIVVAIISIPRINIETNPNKLFKESDFVKVGLDYLQKEFRGIVHFNVTIRSLPGLKQFFKTREGMLAAQKIQDLIDKNIYLKEHSMLGWNISPVTMLQDLNRLLTGRAGIPQDEKVIKKFLTFLKISKNDSIKSIINQDFSAITFQIRTYSTNEKNDFMVTEREMEEVVEILQPRLEHLAQKDGRYNFEIWGETILISKIPKYLYNDQIFSLLFTTLFVFIISLILFRSPYFAFSALIPLSFGVLMNFTIMSIFGISLDIATVMIAAISIGIGIDDSIHFILHYKNALDSGQSQREAIKHTLQYTSRPILFTSLALISGFLVFLLSSFRPIVFFGLLIAVSMFNCTFATLLILPSFFLVTEKIRNFGRKTNK